MTTFRHVLMMRFKDDASEEQIGAFFDGLASMPEEIDQIRRYDFGPDLGLGSSNFGMALVADFDSEDDWHSYTNHPLPGLYRQGCSAHRGGSGASPVRGELVSGCWTTQLSFDLGGHLVVHPSLRFRPIANVDLRC